ncbi:MAG: glycosyltransferase [Nitrospirae bacterium]|nr:glycosyltransferase [Nitrospirota bacterium]
MNRMATPKKGRRLLFVIDQLSGGTGRVFVDLARGLDRARFEPRLAVVHGDSTLLGQWPGDLPVHALRRPGESWRLGRFLAYRRLQKVVEENRIDLVVSALEVSNIYAALLRRSGRRARTLLSYHTNLTAFRRYTRERFSFCGLPMEWYIRHLYAWADAVVSPSRGGAEDLVKTYGLPAGKSRWIPNPVDLGRVREMSHERIEWPWRRGTTPVVSVASVGQRCVDTKGYDVLVRALAEFRGIRAPRLAVLGSGPQEKAVRALAASLGLSDRVWFAGNLENPWKYAAQTDLFVLPSRWETFSLVLVEAMASGLPVLAADCDFGPREIIEHGKSGWLVPPDDPHAMAEALRRLLPRKDVLRRLAGNGRRRAEDFSLSRRVPEYEKLFHEVLSTR